MLSIVNKKSILQNTHSAITRICIVWVMQESIRIISLINKADMAAEHR
jgi:hypothetical protein